MPPFFWKPNAFDDDYDHDTDVVKVTKSKSLARAFPTRKPSQPSLDAPSDDDPAAADEFLLRSLMVEREDLAMKLMETDWAIWVMEERFRTTGTASDR